MLLSQKTLSDALDKELRSGVERELDEAFEFARSSPYPPPEDALLHVFA